MNMVNPRFVLEDTDLYISACLVPWDTEIFGFPVAVIDHIDVTESDVATHAYSDFKEWLDEHDIKLVSCRLNDDKLKASMFLEQHGFRFIEMVLHPYTEHIQAHLYTGKRMSVTKAVESDISAIQSIAERSFYYERIHVDPRLGDYLGNARYGRWVRNSQQIDGQKLLKITHDNHLIGFFIVERNNEFSMYWHLTAIASKYHGRGLGEQAWQAVLQQHKNEGITTVSTTISVRNTPVLNLYSKLGFRFRSPEMTFHWVRD